MHSRLNAIRASRCLAILLTLAGPVCFAPTPAHAFTETNNYPKPEWISAAQSVTGTPGFFHHTFTNAPGNLKAILLVAGDGKISVELNGQPVADAEGRERAAGFDVTPHVRAGENTVRVIQQSAATQNRLGFVLELSSPQGRIHWIVSDTNWLASANGKSWTRVASHGLTSADAAADPFDPKRAFDAYNSWQLAKGANAATPAESLTMPPGFKAELLRSAQPGEDSWIALAFDPQGHLTIAKEKRGLLRFTLGRSAVEKVEVINDTLLECRGLLYAHGALYASANGSHVLLRLRDPKHDGVFDDAQELLHTDGGTGHGRNHVKLGPYGKIYLIHGDDVTLTPKATSHCPPNFFAPDQLIPAAWDESPARLAQRLPLGHLLRADADGTNWEMLCGGLRNPLDVAFNEDGEAFTYDADNERDIGAPWYKPTRVLHLVSGGDYGWRRSTATFPEFRPDCLPPVVNIGVGSPTGIEFGTRAKFPDRWRRGLFISDWAYGRILAVHMKPAGASYTGTSETFVSGRPLNVTDLAFGPDGAMYFVTGGRRTQSGLYRVSSVGPMEKEPEKNAAELAEENKCAELRKLRHQLEASHRPPKPDETRLTVADIWPHLSHADPWIRHAARVALERKSFETWQRKILRPGMIGGGNSPLPVTALLAAVHADAPWPEPNFSHPYDASLTDPLSLNFFARELR
ncbi:MAG: hypothetical protein HY301_20030, partial [Verrucomicrobia bacterium]|nr:hypothetical protein [Verrucomicrobiota bacterium]